MPKILLENEVVVNLVFLGSKQFRERFSSTEHLYYSFIFSILNTGSSAKNDILVMIKKSLTIWSSALRLFFKRCTTYVGKKQLHGAKKIRKGWTDVKHSIVFKASIFVGNPVHRNIFKFYYKMLQKKGKKAEFKEFKPRLKYGWLHLKSYSLIQDLSLRPIETGFWRIKDAAQINFIRTLITWLQSNVVIYLFWYVKLWTNSNNRSNNKSLKNQIASEEKSIPFPNNQTINLNRKLLKSNQNKPWKSYAKTVITQKSCNSHEIQRQKKKQSIAQKMKYFHQIPNNSFSETKSLWNS